MDGLAEFVLKYPQWTVPGWMFWRQDRGQPIGWVAYCHGMAHLNRASAREALQMGGATFAGSRMDDQGWRRWSSELESTAR
jgi:hypothetical protein